MTGPLDEKWLMEESAALAFVEALNLQMGTSFELVEHCDRPDVIIEDRLSGQRIGVEVTHLFYDDAEARMFLGRSREENHPPEYIEDYIERLNALLLQKAEKAKGYEHRDPLGLLVRVVSPVFHILDFQVYAGRIVVPPSDFSYIWLLFYDFNAHRWDVLERLR